VRMRRTRGPGPGPGREDGEGVTILTAFWKHFVVLFGGTLFGCRGMYRCRF
jgi:hypothetical protein